MRQAVHNVLGDINFREPSGVGKIHLIGMFTV